MPEYGIKEMEETQRQILIKTFELRSKGKTNEALDLYKQIIDVNPNSKIALDAKTVMDDMQSINQLLNTISDFISKEDVSKVTLLYKQIIEQFPYSPEAKYAKEQIFNIKNGKYEKTLKIKENEKKIRNLVICPHCDEKIPEDSIKCPYCAENIKDIQISKKDFQKEDKEKPSTFQVSISTKESSDLQLQKHHTNKALSANQTEEDYTVELKKKMMKLEKLLAEGIISENEFKSKREQLINKYIDE